ncbi:MAG TPA: chromate efflux transporter [Gammaproteobacteria bacterium]|nr:chromate efflux transporter [Gammaproteobacteria bacterium]
MSNGTQDGLPSIGRRRLEVLGIFLKIGALGFGVAAIWGLIQAEVQERRQWLSKERFLEGLALVQALPGATALQMCVFTGYQRAGTWGGVLAGVGFVMPAFAIMLALTALHSAYGALPFMRDAFYGLGPVVLGIFAVAVWRLGRNALKDRFSILVALAAIAALTLTPFGPAGIFLLAGCIGVAAHHSLRAGLISGAAVIALFAAEHYVATWLGGQPSGPGVSSNGLWDIGVFFFKVGALTFGGGLTIIAFIQDQVVNQLNWISAEEFLEGLAIGQVTPGPVIMLAAFVGYKVAGVAGAAVAAGAIFLPSFVLLMSILPWLERFRALKWVRAAMRGVSPAVVGAIALTVVHLAPTAAPDMFTSALFVATMACLLLWQVPAVPAAVGGGVLGIVARSSLMVRLREFTF